LAHFDSFHEDLGEALFGEGTTVEDFIKFIKSIPYDE
jgi:hypothetical protein